MPIPIPAPKYSRLAIKVGDNPSKINFEKGVDNAYKIAAKIAYKMYLFVFMINLSTCYFSILFEEFSYIDCKISAINTSTLL